MPDETPISRRFIFTGNAVAFGGRIRRPDDLFLKAAGVASLPVTGGLSESHVVGSEALQHHYKDYLTFSEAHSHAFGDYTNAQLAADYTKGNHGENPVPAIVTVHSHLHDLRIESSAEPEADTPRRVFSVKKLETHMQVTTGKDTEKAAIRSFTASYEGVSLQTGDGPALKLHVKTATEIFTENETQAKLVERYAKDGEFRKKYGSLFHIPGEHEKGFLSGLVEGHEIPFAKTGPTVCSFVTGIELEGGGELPTGIADVSSNRLIVPGLGQIIFGEIIVERGSHRATMLRFELGSIVGGSATGVETHVDLLAWPPGK